MSYDVWREATLSHSLTGDHRSHSQPSREAVGRTTFRTGPILWNHTAPGVERLWANGCRVEGTGAHAVNMGGVLLSQGVQCCGPQCYGPVAQTIVLRGGHIPYSCTKQKG